MAEPQTTPRAERWIVQGDDVVSGRLQERIKSDSEITQVRQVARDVVVLAMSVERANKLKREFGAQLNIERDADLTLNVDPPRD
jgi:hypothetical protein